LATLFWSKRHEFLPHLLPVEEAIEIARRTHGLCVLADSADGTGSGSPGDATDVLRHLLRADLDRPAMVPLVDPEVAQQAFELGEGKTIQADLGGKIDHMFNSPVKVSGTIVRCGKASFTIQGESGFAGVEVSLGQAAVIRSGCVFVLITSRRVWTHDPELFRCVGLQPERANIVVVKSPNMFKAAYAPIAEKMLVVDSQGASPANFPALPYRRVDRAMFPFDRRCEYP
jgi:microcystin degradation protein MlrC